MRNFWLRLYSEFATDPKVQALSEAMQRRLIMLMCDHCSENVTISERHRSFHWRISDVELSETKTLFIENGFIDDNWNLVNWKKRQFLSDSSTERTRRYRERKRTSQERHNVTNETKRDALEQNRTEQKTLLSIFDDPKQEVIQKAWDYYKTQFGRNGNYDFSKTRKGHAEKAWDALKRKCSVLEIPEEERPAAILGWLCDAIDRMKADKFHNGQNEKSANYNDWENLFSGGGRKSPDKLTDYWLNGYKFSKGKQP